MMSQYWTAKNAVDQLQMEKQKLQSQLRSLRHHQNLHNSHVEFVLETKKDMANRRDTCVANLCLLKERRESLIASHLASARGPRAEQYRKLLQEHVELEDRLLPISASHTVVRYSLQKLLIDAVHTRRNITLQVVGLLFSHYNPFTDIALTGPQPLEREWLVWNCNRPGQHGALPPVFQCHSFHTGLAGRESCCWGSQFRRDHPYDCRMSFLSLPICMAGDFVLPDSFPSTCQSTSC